MGLKEELAAAFNKEFELWKNGGEAWPHRDNTFIIELLADIADKKIKALEDRISYLEDRHPDNCSCNECFTP